MSALHVGKVALYIETAAHCEQNLFKRAARYFSKTHFSFAFIYQDTNWLVLFIHITGISVLFYDDS